MLKIGDKVRMTPRGFRFHSNLDISFECGSCDSKMNHLQFIKTTCELFSIHGVGEVKKFSSEGDPFIKFEYTLDGIKYYHSAYYVRGVIKKLSLIDRIKFFMKRFL